MARKELQRENIVLVETARTMLATNRDALIAEFKKYLDKPRCINASYHSLNEPTTLLNIVAVVDGHICYPWFIRLMFMAIATCHRCHVEVVVPLLVTMASYIGYHIYPLPCEKLIRMLVREADILAKVLACMEINAAPIEYVALGSDGTSKKGEKWNLLTIAYRLPETRMWLSLSFVSICI